ncbi:MAG: class I SAM-dependent methyltransferase [Chitinivibrionia bacterium]|nr:class I SAM-dependent methyltransferase [Chitinivibrionia bacterium]
MEQKLYWENVACEKEFTTPFQMEIFKKYVNKNAKILDFGCGYGRTLNELYDNGYKNCFGIDFSEKMLERGKKTYPHLSFEATQKLNYHENTFDAVILLALLTCIISDEEQKKILKKIKKILKPDGIIYINDFLLNDDERNVKRYKKYELKYKNYGVFELEEGAILRHHSKEWVKKMLKIFNELEFKEIKYATMNGNMSNGYYYFGRK